jgi:hypothetical protein
MAAESFRPNEQSHFQRSSTYHRTEKADFTVFLTFARVKSAKNRPEIQAQRQISWNFHSFFHRCGKLWGETKRTSVSAGVGEEFLPGSANKS